ncbi:hypothetical protein QNO07_20445 [Streptomyces sp. 549]|uniref:hypothetical protein n=1 Tax=Streptomyces sp. 549 TaxID=3049076 RepID=UPI0024C45CAF|nr:hypothetical protein [Streptomyces sp. 549]MDK1475759.1 hypothetical protein [Streptomyces sp. 549]
MRSKLSLAFLVALLLTGCSAPWSAEPEPEAVIVPAAAPPVEDKAESQQNAREFRDEAGKSGDSATLGDEVKDVYGDWENGGDRAFISTGLKDAEATKANGKRLADAFSAWRDSESGKGRVMVYDAAGDLLYDGEF